MRITVRIARVVGAVAVALGLALSSTPSHSALAQSTDCIQLDPGSGGFGWSLDHRTYTTQVAEVNQSGICGQATLTDNGDGTTTVAITLDNARMGWSYQASIHDGTADKYSAEASYQLNALVDGASSTVLKVSLKDLLSVERAIVVAGDRGAVAISGLCNPGGK